MLSDAAESKSVVGLVFSTFFDNKNNEINKNNNALRERYS